MSDIADVFDALAKERAYQDEKYGIPAERALSIGDYLVIARGELLEAECMPVEEAMIKLSRGETVTVAGADLIEVRRQVDLAIRRE